MRTAAFRSGYQQTSAVEQLSIPVAAEQLGVSVGKVYVSRSRVMHRLRELVREFEVVG